MFFKSSARKVTVAVAILASLGLAACAIEEEGVEEDEAITAEEDEIAELAAMDQASSADHVREEAYQGDGSRPVSIQVHDYNGICAHTQTLRDVPGGYTLCTMTRHNTVYVYQVSGEWAYIRVLSGHCEGHVGWSLKGTISRLCL